MICIWIWDLRPSIWSQQILVGIIFAVVDRLGVSIVLHYKWNKEIMFKNINKYITKYKWSKEIVCLKRQENDNKENP